ncbi:hypothetical protein, partial [Streptomyces parvus]|uniref:hypothetical protein n=1 Tax=Streptomyces parvus TaxID=66428 RepID=UPI001AD70BFC
MEVNRRGALDFGGSAAGDHRLPADPEIRTEGRARGGLHAARVLHRELVHRTDHLRPDDQRGGNLLATGVLALLAAVQSDEAFLAWGWRIPFLLSGV